MVQFGYFFSLLCVLKPCFLLLAFVFSLYSLYLFLITSCISPYKKCAIMYFIKMWQKSVLFCVVALSHTPSGSVIMCGKHGQLANATCHVTVYPLRVETISVSNSIKMLNACVQYMALQ